MEEKMLKILMKYIGNPNAALNARKELLGLFSVSESTSIKPISTELSPQMKEYIAHLKWADNAMREYANKMLMIPKEYFD